MKHNLRTRRQAIVGVAAVLGCVSASYEILAQTPPVTAEKPSNGPDAKRTSLHQEVVLPSSPRHVYDMLLDSKQFAAFTGEPAEIGREEGSAFSMFSGVIVGRNIELAPGQRIVQAWRPTHWTPGTYSIVRFELNAQDSDTKLTLDHTGFPEGDFSGLYYGWGLKYWDPMKKFLARASGGSVKSTP